MLSPSVFNFALSCWFSSHSLVLCALRDRGDGSMEAGGLDIAGRYGNRDEVDGIEMDGDGEGPVVGACS